MNRRGDGATVREALAKIRREIFGRGAPHDRYCGLPGETDEDFTELCEFVKETEFDRFGAFTFLARVRVRPHTILRIRSTRRPLGQIRYPYGGAA